MSTIYAGPGKVWMNNKALWPQGENGEIKAEVKQRAVDVVSGFFGRVTGLQGDAQAIISLTPFDNWSALSLLFPAYLGVTVGATPGALALGTRPHNPNAAADLPAKIWSPDGRLYTFPRTAVTKHPDLHLGIDQPLFGPVELAAIIASGATLGGSGSLYTLTPSGATDPGGQQSGSDFQRGPWYGVWGTVAGFGGDGSSSPVEAEEEWVITTVAKYSPLQSKRSSGPLSWIMCPLWPGAVPSGQATPRSTPPSPSTTAGSSASSSPTAPPAPTSC